MSTNTNLYTARNAKKDEFYTQLEDIEAELKHYRKQFRDKVVLCNCDDPYESDFFKYFVLNFNRLQLKKLICTSYSGSPIMGQQLSMFDIDRSDAKTPYKAEVTKVYDITGDGAISMDDIKALFIEGKNTLTRLKGNGDFRSDECIEILKEADIVVTNPPFSLFREYVALLMKYDKQFVIIGHQNAITYKDFFPYLKDNKIWIGYGFKGNAGFFRSEYEDTAKSSQHKDGMIRVSGVMWFTNIDIKKHHEEMILFRRYDPEVYPKYDNYDAINVDVTAEIPCDYSGVMGVPITFLNKYCPEQFEIVGMDGQECSPPTKVYSSKRKVVNGQHMKSLTGTMGCVVRTDTFGKGTYFDVGYPVKAFYKRIFIRNKHPEEPEVK